MRTVLSKGYCDVAAVGDCVDGLGYCELLHQLSREG